MQLETAFFVVQALAAADTGAGATTMEIGRGYRSSDHLARRHMRELEALGCVQVVQAGPGKRNLWSLTEAGQGLLRAAQG